MTRYLLLSLNLLFYVHSLSAKVYKLGAQSKSMASELSISNISNHHIKFNYKTNYFNAHETNNALNQQSLLSLSFDKLKNAQSVNKAALPYKSFIVGAKPSEIRYQVSIKETHLFKNLWSDYAKALPCRCENDRNKDLSFDPKTYYEFDKKIVKLDYLGDYRGRHFTKVTIKAARQTSKGLEVFEDLKVDLYSQSNLDASDIVELASQKYFMVAPSALMSSAKIFADFKRTQGFEVSLYEYESVAGDTRRLTSFIKEKYRANKFQFALIFGHEHLIEPHFVMTSTSTQTPSDHPFFVMGGAQDIIPDVFYGRISADTNDEVLNQLDKVKEFINRSWDDSSGAYRSLGIASNEGFNPTDVEYMHSMLEPIHNNYSIVPDYYFQDDNRSQVKGINASLNKGVRWLNYIGHGIGDSWPSIYQGEYTSQDIYDLHSEVVKPVIIDVACQNGRFNNQQKLGETFMNATRNNRPIGAVAYFGGSVDISWDPPAIMAAHMGELLAKGNHSTLYELILAGQIFLLGHYEDIEAAKENLLWYHLLGDPSLPVLLP